MRSWDYRSRRPWAYWRFDLNEDPPEDLRDQTIRLAELGDLADAELAELAERANEARLRIGTSAEHISAARTEVERHPDRERVELYEAVTRP